jgi:hypothetical protein
LPEEGGEGRGEEQLLPLKSVFDCPHIQVRVANGGKSDWECKWCGMIIMPKHASRTIKMILLLAKRSSPLSI